jgi:hypothetical protein
MRRYPICAEEENRFNEASYRVITYFIVTRLLYSLYSIAKLITCERG